MSEPRHHTPTTLAARFNTLAERYETAAALDRVAGFTIGCQP